jgi:hypothetical protein
MTTHPMEGTTVKLLEELRQYVEGFLLRQSTKKIFVGFDGFVDTIMKAVKQKQNFKTIYFNTISEFASRIDSAAGKSGQIELVTERVRFGGNAPIMGNTLAKFNIHSYCAGSLGCPENHPIFTAMDDKCEIISLANPGDSRAIEFQDGKIILSELSAFAEYDWNSIKKTQGIERIKEAIMNSSIIAFVDWVNLPYSSEIWEGVLSDIIRPSGRKDFVFLFDLCDPSKKTTQQTDEILDVISSFSSYGSVTLGLNENETIKIWCALNGKDAMNPEGKDKIPGVRDAGSAIYKTMNIDCLLIHPVDRTIVYRKHETIELKGRLVIEPKVLTGGGDNLNAGYCLGILNGLSIQHCMLLGMAASGAYIQNGTSPDLKSIVEYIRIWSLELQKQPNQTPGHVFSHRHE